VRGFRKVAGTSPLAFLTELRLNLARQLLLASHEPIGTIADHVGITPRLRSAEPFCAALACDRRRLREADGNGRFEAAPPKAGSLT
jgi:AraC-like DNA-binding protein